MRLNSSESFHLFLISTSEILHLNIFKMIKSNNGDSFVLWSTDMKKCPLKIAREKKVDRLRNLEVEFLIACHQFDETVLFPNWQ